MSAQPQEAAPMVNGASSGARCDPGTGPADVQAAEQTTAMPEVPAEQTSVVDELVNEPGPSHRPLGSLARDATVEPSGTGPESMQRQEQPITLSTTSVLDGHPSGELLTDRRAGTFGNSEFMTPRSNTPMPSAQNNWLGGLEVPRWFTRLGSYLSVGHAELAPSPLLGSPSTPTPPGGQAFRLRSPGRAPRPLPAPPTPPSSSDIPQEAIQAEVQRQLGSLLNRLQSAEEQNHRLRLELDETQRNLQTSRQELISSQSRRDLQVSAESRGIVSDGHAGTVQQPTLPPTVSVLQSNYVLPPDPNLPQGHSVPYSTPQPRGDLRLGGNLADGPTREFTSQTTNDLPRVHAATAPPIAPAPPPMTESRGFLRSFLGANRPRGETPPPPRAAPATSPESPMMDALMKGVQQLQELQAAALAKGQSLAAEVVKPGTTTLAALPLPAQGAETALLFQDWLEVTSSVMRDVSEQSGVWWEAVLQEVDRSYRTWLSATPLERLSVSPDGRELSEGRWTRLNARVASMMLTAMTTEQRSHGCPQDFNQCGQDALPSAYGISTRW